MIGRREFIAVLSGAAAWPLRAQQGGPSRRIGVLIGTPADDAIGQARMAAFLQGLGQLDWMVGRNVRMGYHNRICRRRHYGGAPLAGRFGMA